MALRNGVNGSVTIQGNSSKYGKEIAEYKRLTSTLCVIVVSVTQFLRVSVLLFSFLKTFLKEGNSSGEAQQIDWKKTAVNRPRSIYQGFRSAQTSLFGVVFFSIQVSFGKWEKRIYNCDFKAWEPC